MLRHIIEIVPNLQIEEILQCKRAVMHLIYGDSIGTQSCLLSPAEDIAVIFEEFSNHVSVEIEI